MVERSYRTTAYHLAYYAHLHLFRTNKTNDQYILLFLLLNFMQIRIYSVHFASQHLIISLQYIFSFLYNNKSILLPHYVMIKLYFELCVFFLSSRIGKLYRTLIYFPSRNIYCAL